MLPTGKRKGLVTKVTSLILIFLLIKTWSADGINDVDEAKSYCKYLVIRESSMYRM